MFFVFSRQTSKQKGFSLLEILIAVAIIATGIVGALSLSLQGIQVGKINEDNLTASLLAQECLEMARNVRDQNWDSDWDYDTDLIGDFDFDYSGERKDGKAKLYFTADGFYAHTGPEESKFSRLLTTSDEDDHLKLECVVTWDDRGQERNYSAFTKLYDWY